MPLYEHVFLARQDLAQAQVDALAETATSIVEANQGKVTKVENWGLRSLAYKIAKNRKAHYVMLNIDGPCGCRCRAGAPDPDQRRRDPLHDREGRGAGSRPSVMMRKSDRDRERRGGRDGDRPDRGDRGDRGPRRERDAEGGF
jgi:small subunit ribosomal protein S6